MKVCPRCSEVFQDQVERCPSDGEPLVSASDPLIGKTVGGRYRLISRLGTGGMSSVYLARHVLIDRLVAVKSLRRDLAQDPLQRDRFIREARAVNRINHENIVEITDFGETEDGLVYLVMEYVPGEPLFKAMSRGPFSSVRALNIAEQIAGALGRAHQMGVVHRDLKPENLLLVPRKGRPDFIKVLDFGIAKILDAPSLTGSQQIFGTPGYIAPEYIQSTDIDGRADLYSLGVILYELVTKALPFDYEYPGDLLVKHVTEAPIPPRKRREEVEQPVEDLILQALEKNPDQRFRDAYHFLEALRTTRERLGGDESWGAMGERAEEEPEDQDGAESRPTPIMSTPNQDDLVRRSLAATATDQIEVGEKLDYLADTEEEGEAVEVDPGETVREGELSPVLPDSSIPGPPPAGVAGPNPSSDRGANRRTRGPSEVGRGTPSDGIVGSRRWRRRFDAIRSALDDIEIERPAPAYIAQHMAFAAERLEELEAAVGAAEKRQQEMEDVEAQGREHRATLGRATDELAETLSSLGRQRAGLEQRRGDLEAARDEHLRTLEEEGEGSDADGTGDAMLLEMATLEEEIRERTKQEEMVEAQLSDLHQQIEDHGAKVEAQLSELVSQSHREMIQLDQMASSLRAPLEAVERYVRGWWDEHEPSAPGAAEGSESS